MGKELRDLVVKDDQHRLVEGYANVEIVDKQGDIVPTDTLRKAFLSYMSHGGLIMKQHQNQPVGKIIEWSVAKNDEGVDGIHIIGEIFKDGAVADEMWTDVKAGIVKGFSIAGKSLARESRINKDTGDTVNILKEIDLNEISIVRDPANPDATIDSFSISKSLKEEGDETNDVKTRDFDDIEDTIHKGIEGFYKASYPWDKCVEQQEARYGSKKVAEEVCGKIRSKYGKSVDDENPYNSNFINGDEKSMDKKKDEEDEVDKALYLAMEKEYTVEKGFLFEKCIEDQMARYHDQAIAEKVCGAIRQRIMQSRGYGYKDHNSETHKANYEDHSLENYDKLVQDTAKVVMERINDQFHKNDNINSGNRIGETMTVKKGRTEEVGDKDMNEEAAESGGLKGDTKPEMKSEEREEEEEEEKGNPISTRIEEEEHARAKKAEEGHEEEEEDEEKEGDEDRISKLEGKIDKLFEMLSGRGEHEEETEKANYSDKTEDVGSRLPKSPVEDGRKKGGVGLEQYPGSTLRKAGDVSNATEKSFNGDYFAKSLIESSNSFESALTNVLKTGRIPIRKVR